MRSSMRISTYTEKTMRVQTVRCCSGLLLIVLTHIYLSSQVPDDGLVESSCAHACRDSIARGMLRLLTSPCVLLTMSSRSCPYPPSSPA